MHGHILVKLHNYSLLGYDDILKVMGIKVKVTAVAAEAYQLPCWRPFPRFWQLSLYLYSYSMLAQ